MASFAMKKLAEALDVELEINLRPKHAI